MATQTAEVFPLDDLHVTTVQLGRYELSAEIAQSEWGALWRGRSSQDGTDVVVRRIPRVAGLEQEQFDLVCEAAWLAIELRHPAVAAVLDVVITPDEVAVVSEQAGTRTLAQVLAEDRARGVAMPTLAALHIAFDVLSGLGAAHTLWAELGASAEPFFGVLEPSSILIDARGYAKLIDIGLAGCIPAPTWMAPESDTAQYRAPERRRTGACVDGRADIFSVGVLLWEMLSNRKLSPAMLQAPPSAIIGGLPRALGAIVARALEADPRARYQSTDEMAQAIRTVASGSRPPRSVRPSMPVSQRSQPPPSQPPVSQRSQPPPAASGIRMLEPVTDDMLELITDERPTRPNIPRAPAVPLIATDAEITAPAPYPVGSDAAEITRPAPYPLPADTDATRTPVAVPMFSLPPDAAPADAAPAEAVPQAPATLAPAAAAAVTTAPIALPSVVAAPLPEPAPPFRARRRWVLAAFVAVTCAGLAFVALTVRSGASHEPPRAVPAVAPAGKPSDTLEHPPPAPPNVAPKPLAPPEAVAAGDDSSSPTQPASLPKRRKAAVKLPPTRPPLYRPPGL